MQFMSITGKKEMKFLCNNCNTEKDFGLDFALGLITADGEYKRFCADCRRPKSFVPDVYWDGKPEHNLADDPITGKPRIFSSKGEKATYLRERGLQEAGDPVHGAPLSLSNQKHETDSRSQVRDALRRVQEMGKDRRRQEYLRIIKQGRRYN